MEKHKIINNGEPTVLVLQKFVQIPQGESEFYFSKRTLKFARDEISLRGLNIRIEGEEFLDEDKNKRDNRNRPQKNNTKSESAE